MLSLSNITPLCTEDVLADARDMDEGGRSLLTKRCRRIADQVAISCHVLDGDDWSDRASATVRLDAQGAEILDASCTCRRCAPANLCVHAAALALSFSREPKRFLGFEDVEFARTSDAITTFIEETNAEANDGLSGNVELAVALTQRFGEWSARVRIGCGEVSYAVKDLPRLVEDIEHGAFRAYGKRLAFSHVPAAFSENARRIAGVLRRACARTGKTPRRRVRASESIDLTVDEVVDILYAIGPATFTVDWERDKVRETFRAHTASQDPSLQARIVEDDGGYYLMCDDAAYALWDGLRLVIALDGVFHLCSERFARYGKFLHDVYCAGSAGHFIERGDIARFCTSVLPIAREALRLSLPRALEACAPKPCSLSFYFDYDDHTIQCDGYARYGTRSHPLFEACDPPRSRQSAADSQASCAQPAPYRDARAERRAREMLMRYFAAPSEQTALVKSDPDRLVLLLDVRRENAAGELLYGGLAKLRETGDVYTTPAFDRLLKKRTPTLSFGLSFAGNLIELDIASDDVPKDELHAVLASHRKKKHYHRLASGAYIDIDAMDFAALDDIEATVPAASLTQRDAALLMPNWFAPYLFARIPEATASKEAKSELACLTGASAREDGGIPAARAWALPDMTAIPGFTGTLRAYQAHGVSWLSNLSEHGLAGILADEMGLGKSVQLIAFLARALDQEPSRRPSLIVCPASMIYNWTSEFARFAPGLRVSAIEGDRARRSACIARALDAHQGESARTIDVMVTSYQALRRDIDQYRGKALFCCALDEAQAIKNANAKTTRAVKELDASLRLALTGTPVENRPSELWSLFDFLMPGFLGSAMHFRETFELGILGGERSVAKRLHDMIDPFVLRRTKAEVAADLPDKLEHVVYANMEAAQRKLYAAYEQNLRESLLAQKQDPIIRNDARRDRTVDVLAELTRLRQLCCDPSLVLKDYRGGSAKIAVIADLVQSACDEGKKTLVFSQFTSFLDVIEKEFEHRGIGYQELVGAHSAKERINTVDSFNENDVPVLCVSLKAGGCGLNVTGASVVIHADPWWNQAAHEQATGRAHRIGQADDVIVYDVVVRGTIEERIRKLQDKKRAMAGELIENHAGFPGRPDVLDDEQLFALLDE